jgi:putative Mn2+ efflux pump MntP
MSIFELALLAVAMAFDAFTVCLGAGTRRQVAGVRPFFRLAFHFGLFQFIMPVFGWLAGVTVERYIFALDHWVAFSLLAFIGLRMLRAGSGPDGGARWADPSRGWTMVLLSIAVSIDALAVGLSLGLVEVFVWYPAIIIGVTTGLMSWLGLRLGGGIVLIGIGMRILVSHCWPEAGRPAQASTEEAAWRHWRPFTHGAASVSIRASPFRVRG